MFNKLHSRATLLFGVLLLAAAPAAFAERGGGHGNHGGGGGYRGGYSRGYAAPSRNYYNGGGRVYYSGPRYVAPRYYGGYYPGRFYAGRGYFYGGSFWARPYFGIGVGIPWGYGYATNRGCGYVDGWGRFFPAPCYDGYYAGY